MHFKQFAIVTEIYFSADNISTIFLRIVFSNNLIILYVIDSYLHDQVDVVRGFLKIEFLNIVHSHSLYFYNSPIIFNSLPCLHIYHHIKY